MYLLRTVALADGDWVLSTPLTRYHAEKGSPPGRWLGSAVTAAYETKSTKPSAVPCDERSAWVRLAELFDGD